MLSAVGSWQVFFCFGTTHFCNECHDEPGRMQSMQSNNQLPKCPAGPLGTPLTACVHALAVLASDVTDVTAVLPFVVQASNSPTASARSR